MKLSYVQLTKLHVSTPWGHLQANKIRIIQVTSEVVYLQVPVVNNALVIKYILQKLVKIKVKML